MAGGVPSGATEGSSMGPDCALFFSTFSGSFLGTPFAPKTLLFARKNQHFEVHFGVDFGVHFGAEKTRKSAPKKGPENDHEKAKKSDRDRGPYHSLRSLQKEHLQPCF